MAKQVIDVEFLMANRSYSWLFECGSLPWENFWRQPVAERQLTEWPRATTNLSTWEKFAPKKKHDNKIPRVS